MPKKKNSSSVDARGLLRRSGLRAKKGLGQHFLIDESVLEVVIQAAELSPKDVVIEVGPGLGVLTFKLGQLAGEVIAVELDTKLVSILRQRASSMTNLRVVNADILKVTPRELLGGDMDYKVVANLPYYITSPVLRHFVEASLRPSLMVVMVQKEVAEAIVASPGDMSLLAVSLQVYSKPSIVSYVPSLSFYPPPKVDSAIVRFDMLLKPAVEVDDMDSFFETVRCGFSARRKQLCNSLAQGLGMKKATVAALLDKANIEHQRRAETLSLGEWQRLHEAVASAKKDGVLC